MIWKNFVRDLRRTASRLISVSIITMIAVMVYTALSGILTNIERISASYLEGQNVADYWLTGVNLDQGDCRTLEGIAGVTGVQPRVVLDAEERHDSGVTLQLYAVPGDYAINTPYVVEGRLPESSREIVLSDTLAGARGLHPGDWYELTLTGTGRYLRVRISGLVKDPECLYYVNTTTPAPDLTHYAFAYGNETLLQELMGANRYNQICITTDGSLSAARLRLAVDAALGDRVVNILSLEDNTQAYYLLEMRDNLAPILNIFPVLFFLCAVLMMVSTMNRLIENARSDIGTFKALGYSDAKIMCYYLLHALLVVVVGFPVGAWLGRYVSALIVSTIAIGCDLPPYTVVHDFAAWGRALGLTALCCIGSAWLVARSLLKETPAQCMRPKPPRSTKPVALERLGPVWHRLGFNQKYIIRNTLRNKVRMATCIFGIAFCMALVFLAFALRDSIQAYSDALAERLGDYDFVDAWQTRQAATAAAVERLSSMSMVVYILILFGGGLACIVIYNLGIMSFFEQLRSLATLMVLGFYEKEIKTLQLSENIIFAVCGILLGIPLGVSLNRMILASITTMPLMEATRPASLALSCAVTLLFALAVNVVIGRKMREIDMLGALKSVE